MRFPIFAVAAALVTSFTFAAAADVPSPDQSACQGKSLGATCTPAAGGTGSCQNETCTKVMPSPDGGVATTNYPCVLCRGGDAGTPPTDAGADAGGSSAGGSGPGSFGCSVGGGGSLLGAFAIAMAVPLLVRRRRRS
jgi:MYXO-CTERM domain-containing protein